MLTSRHILKRIYDRIHQPLIVKHWPRSRLHPAYRQDADTASRPEDSCGWRGPRRAVLCAPRPMARLVPLETRCLCPPPSGETVLWRHEPRPSVPDHPGAGTPPPLPRAVAHTRDRRRQPARRAGRTRQDGSGRGGAGQVGSAGHSGRRRAGPARADSSCEHARPF